MLLWGASDRLTIRFQSNKFELYRTSLADLAAFDRLRPGFAIHYQAAHARVGSIFSGSDFMRALRVFSASIFLSLIAASVSFAQIAAGLRGRVLDPCGAAGGNARIVLIESACK